MPVEVILRVPACLPVDQVADFVAEAEEAGFAGVGIPDTQLVVRDSFIALALAAKRTSRIGLYTAVTNPVTRHASVLASLAQTLEELAPGRLTLMVGTGFSAVSTIGRPPATRQKMREVLSQVRYLLAGGVVEFGSAKSKLTYTSRPPIPFFVAARGPKNLEMAGEIGDGVLANVGLHPTNISFAQQHIDAGVARSGRDPASVDRILDVYINIAPTRRQAYDEARPICAHWVTQPPLARLLRNAGLEIPDISLPPELLEVYPDIYHAEDQEAVAKLTTFLSDEMIEKVCSVIGAYGTAEDVAQRLAKAEEQGITRIFIRPKDTYALPTRTLEAFRDVIFPMLGQRVAS